MTIRHRVIAFLKTRRRARLVEESARPAVDAREVWGAERTPTGGWRLIGRDESPLADYLPPGASDSPGNLREGGR